MSKITKALKRASEEKAQHYSDSEESQNSLVNKSREGKMHKSFTWFFIVAAIIVVFVAFNYQSGKDAVPLSEIFPDEQALPVDVEYEFVQDESDAVEVSEVVEVTQVKEDIETTPDILKEMPKAAVKSDRISFSPQQAVVDKAYNFTVQIASFKDKKRSEEALKKIRAQVPTAYISTHDLGSKGVWHRIYAGQFELRNDAEVALSGIKRSYDGSFIIAPKKAK